MNRSILLGVLLLAALHAGCASSPETRQDCPDAPPIALTIEATDELNPDDDGVALATELRIYQVRDSAALEMASFEEVWQDAAAALGDALVSEETLTVYPGSRLERALRPDPETTAIVGVVIVRQPAGRTWRALVPITTTAAGPQTCPGPAPTRFRLRLDGYRIEAIVPVSRRSPTDDASS